MINIFLLLCFFNVNEIMTSDNPLVGQVLWIGPGAETLGKSEEFTLPSLLPSTTLLVPPHPQTSLQGSVAQLIGTTLHVCGGLGSNTASHDASSTMLSTCYNYTIGQAEWIPAKNMLEKRWGAASVQMEDGSFWVTGGYSSGILNSTEVWKHGVWQNSVQLPRALEYHCMVQLNETHTLLAGGWTDIGGAWGSVSNETWNYGNGVFMKQKDMLMQRFSHSCAAFNNQVWAVGGQQDFSNQLNSVEIFCLSTLTWKRGPDLPVPTTGGQLVQHEGSLLFIGGVIGEGDRKNQTSHIYKLDGWDWIKVPEEMETPRAHFNALVLKSDILGEDRDNLTLRVTALCPQSWNYSLFLGGSGAWLSSDPSHRAVLPMTLVSNDTWQFDINYSNGLAGYNCNNCYVNDIIQTGENLHIRIFALKGQDLIPMLGAMTRVTFPISATSSYFDVPPEVIITPNFDNLRGDVHSFSAVHPLFGERSIGVYLPPGLKNPYKKISVTIAIDVNSSTIEQDHSLLDTWFANSITETAIVGFGDWKRETLEARKIDRSNLLTPVLGDLVFCKNGSILNFCNGCLDRANFTLSNRIRCSNVIRVGGGAELLLDWLLGDILSQIEKSWPGRLLTDRDHLGIVGYSLGGLFACHAAWTRHQVISRAACQSSSFFWPTNAKIVVNEFNFINNTLKDSKFHINRFPQRILIDVGDGEAIGWEGDSFWMAGAAQLVANEMEKFPVFYKDRNLWLHVYPGKGHSGLAWVDRLWNSLKIMWN